jgi:hypothetical protein
MYCTPEEGIGGQVQQHDMSPSKAPAARPRYIHGTTRTTYYTVQEFEQNLFTTEEVPPLTTSGRAGWAKLSKSHEITTARLAIIALASR